MPLGLTPADNITASPRFCDCDGCRAREAVAPTDAAPTAAAADATTTEQCAICERIRITSEMREDPRGGDRSICSACYYRYWCKCVDCGESTHRDDAVHTTRGLVCEGCAENYSRCVACGELHPEDEDCPTCAGEELRGVHAHDYRPEAVYHTDDGAISPRPAAGTYYYGVELEVEVKSGTMYDEVVSKAKEMLGSFAYLKSDGSLAHGFEIVTHPATVASHRARWKRFHDHRPAGLLSFNTTTCGLHIHVSRAPMHELQVAKIVCFVSAIDNRSYIETVAARGQNDFVKILRKELRYAHIAGSSEERPSGSSDRYQAVNLQNRHTIEFRIFRGNLRPEALWKALEFCAALVHFAAETDTPTSLDHKEFVSYVAKAKATYPALHAFHVLTGYVQAEVTTTTTTTTTETENV